MAGISSKAAGKLENKYRYNGIENNTDFNLNLYDAFYRNLDPQIGRFLQIDPKPNEMISPYSAMINNPVRFIDPLGDTTQVKIGDNYYYVGRLKDGGVGYFGNDGKQYKGEIDDFAQAVLDAVNTMAGAKDDEIQTRLNEVLTGKKMITIEIGEKNNLDEKTGILSWGKGKNTIMLNNGGDINKRGKTSNTLKDADLILGHELLGHGYQFQRGFLNHDRMELFTNSQLKLLGFAEKCQADATTIENRLAMATKRPDMVEPIYIEAIQGKDMIWHNMYHEIPYGYLINNRATQDPTNYRSYNPQ